MFKCISNKRMINSAKSFSIKFIPIRRLNFKDEGYEEKLCNIYTAMPNTKLATKQKFLKIFSFLLFSTTFKFGTISALINVALQPLLIRSIYKNKKKLTMDVVRIFLIKNGTQVMIITTDGSYHIVNIHDFIKFTQNEDVLRLETFEKTFFINLEDNENINSDIIRGIKERRQIDTNNCIRNYHRFTFKKYNLLN
jgi:hypothetical protein